MNKKTFIIVFAIAFCAVGVLFILLNVYLHWYINYNFEPSYSFEYAPSFGRILVQLLPIYLASKTLILAGIFLTAFFLSKKIGDPKALEQSNDSQTKQENAHEKTALDYLDSGIIVLKDNTNVQFINQIAAKLVSYKKDKGLFYFMADTEFYDAIETRKNTFICRKIDNLEYIFNFIFDGDKTIVVINDITRLKTAEDTKNEFIETIYHQINTPLASIASYAELIKQGMNEKNTKDAINTISHTSRRLGGLVKSLLKYCQIDINCIAPQDIDLSKVIKESAANLSSYMQDKRIEMKLEIDDGVVVNSHREHVVDLVNNLISNGIKYNIEGGCLAVRLSSPPKILTIEDSGVGIKEEDMDRVFDMFYTLGADEQGCGMGLAIVKKIALYNNWKIKTESTLNKGTKFSIEF